MVQRSSFFSRVFVSALLCAAAGAALAQYPSKPVRIIVPFPPGGATDVVTRILAQSLTEKWGQQVLVENRAGAGGNIGADAVAKSAPDGYTLLMTSGSIVTSNQHIYKKMPFDPAKDLLPITNVATGPMVIEVHPSVPVKNLRELIALAKKNPGKYNYGSAGFGSQVHLAGESFLYAAGLDITHVPYKGAGPALNDLVAGQLTMMPDNIASSIGFIYQKKLRPLAVTSKERSPLLPEVPTVAEQGFPGFEASGWFGLMAPAGTPGDVVQKVYADAKLILDTTQMRARLFTLGMRPVANTPDEMRASIARESANWAVVVRERKISAN